MHDYGVYVVDSTGDGSTNEPGVPGGFGDESAQFRPYGVADPTIQTMVNLGWQGDQLGNNCTQWPVSAADGGCSGSQTEYRYGNKPWGAWIPFADGWKNHLRILDPCNARQTC
jgi:hypothetical protein